MIKILKIFFPSLIILALLATGACSVNNTVSNLPEPDYAGDITENLLLGVNNNDYVLFSRDFDEAMKKAVPQATFNTQFIEGIKGKIGDYEGNSKRFFQASTQAQYLVVVYFVRYTNEPGGTLVQVTFQQVEGKPLVSGIIFNSPKLRG